MALIFAARGDSLDARYAGGEKTGIQMGASFAVTADATAISGSAYVAAANNTPKTIIWQGPGNTPTGTAISLHQRFKTGYAGSPTASRPVLPYLLINGGRFGRLEISHNSAGNIAALLANEAGTTIVNTTFGLWAPVATTWYDIVLTWDYSNTANLKLYIDGVLLGTITPTAAMSAVLWNEICLSGGIIAVNYNGASIDGIHIWDEVINPTSVTLDSGTGSLNGASRTSQIAATSFEGNHWTALTADKIKSGETQYQAGSLVTGTYSETPAYLTLSQFLALKDL